MRVHDIDIPITEIEAFCERHKIRKLSLFGSILRDDFRANSDIDVLVEFERDAHTGLNFITMQDELAEMLGRPVDLATPAMLNTRIRAKILASAQTVCIKA